MFSLIAIGASLMFLFTLFRAVKIWHNPRHYEYVVNQLKTLPFRKDVTRGLVRGNAVNAAEMGAMSVLFGMGWVVGVDSPDFDADAHPLFTPVAIGLIFACIALFLVHMLVVWFNWPRWCVPPYLRNEPGVWRSRRSA